MKKKKTRPKIESLNKKYVQLRCIICSRKYSIKISSEKDRERYTPEVRKKWICVLCRPWKRKKK